MRNVFKNKRIKFGFTLIELLAVIVILAIIALIATPIILGIVEDARKDAFLRSVELVIRATDIDIFSKNYTDKYTYTIEDGNIPNLEVGVKNTDGMNGNIVYDKQGKEEYAINNGKYCVRKNDKTIKPEIIDYDGECEIYPSTPANCFETEDVVKYEIIDFNKCVSYFEDSNYPTEDANMVCKNYPNTELSMEMFTRYLEEFKPEEMLNILLDENIIIKKEGLSIKEYTCFENDIRIPSKIDGKPVLELGRESFARSIFGYVEGDIIPLVNSYAFSATDLNSVVIPNTVISIESNAFPGNGLNNVEIGNSVNYIGTYAFANNNLKKITIPDSVIMISYGGFYSNQLNDVKFSSNLVYIDEYAFASNSLDKIKLPDSLIEIDKYAFQNNKIKELIIPDNVKNIQEKAFIYNDLTKVVIGKNVEYMGKGAIIKGSGDKNLNLNLIINKTGKSLCWGSPVNGTSYSDYCFVTGTINNPYGYGNIEVREP